MATFIRASSCAGGSCVEVAGPFTKATASSPAGHCVEVAGCTCGRDVIMRDSKNPDGPTLAFALGAWRDFIAAVRAGEFRHQSDD